MANTLYNAARKDFLEGVINWGAANTGDDIYVRLVKTSEYSFSASHGDMTDVGGSSRVGNAVKLVTDVTNDGAADADDVTFSAVEAGDQVGAIIIYKQISGSEDSQTRLIAFLDTATGLPITTNGGDIIITWDNGINRIFRL